MDIVLAAWTHCAACFVAYSGQPVRGFTQTAAAEIKQRSKGHEYYEGNYQGKDDLRYCHNMSAAKIIEMDKFRFDSEVVKHVQHGLQHHGWAADVIIYILRGRMIAQV